MQRLSEFFGGVACSVCS